jgi:histidinol-phosphatase
MDDLALAHRLAGLAAEVALDHLRKGVVAEDKPDGTRVTAADRDVEEAIYRLVQGERPRDAFVGEETGSRGASLRRWIVDGIDGTNSFATGGVHWGTLIALEESGTLLVGMIESPLLRRRWWAARGDGASVAVSDHGSISGRSPLRVSSHAELSDARLGLGPPISALVGWRADLVRRLSRRCRIDRPEGGDYALLVAEAELDLFLFLGGGFWDYAAMALVVEESGGKWSDLDGLPRLDQGALLCSNGLLHDETLATIAPLR